MGQQGEICWTLGEIRLKWDKIFLYKVKYVG